MKIVLDTDVVVSGLRSASGASRIILLAVRERVVTPIMNVAMMLEYEAVLKRPENLAAAGLDSPEVDTLLDGWAALCQPVFDGFSHRPSIRECR